MMALNRLVANLGQAAALARDVSANANIRTLASMLGPAFRGLVLQRGKDEDVTALNVGYPAAFDWRYRRSAPPPQPLSRARVLRRTLRARHVARSLGRGGQAFGDDDFLPADDVQTHRPEPQTNRPAG